MATHAPEAMWPPLDDGELVRPAGGEHERSATSATTDFGEPVGDTRLRYCWIVRDFYEVPEDQHPATHCPLCFYSACCP